MLWRSSGIHRTTVTYITLVLFLLLTARGGALALDDIYQKGHEESTGKAKTVHTSMARRGGVSTQDRLQQMRHGSAHPVEPEECARRCP